MAKRLSSRLKLWLPPFLVLVAVIVLTIIWYVTFPPSAWAEKPNYFQMYINFVLQRPVDAFLSTNVGPGGIIGGTFILVYSLIAVHTILYIVDKRVKQPIYIAGRLMIQPSVVTRKYLFYLVALALFALSFQNAAQHYDWYWNPELDAPGYVDTWTHITSPWLLGALFVPFALERYLGWDRKYYWFPIFAIMITIALGWEIVETLDVYVRPETSSYFNYPMDSIKDIIMGSGIGTVLSCWIYERLVIDEEKQLEKTV
jgi:hypothetical protein